MARRTPQEIAADHEAKAQKHAARARAERQRAHRRSDPLLAAATTAVRALNTLTIESANATADASTQRGRLYIGVCRAAEDLTMLLDQLDPPAAVTAPAASDERSAHDDDEAAP